MIWTLSFIFVWAGNLNCGLKNFEGRLGGLMGGRFEIQMIFKWFKIVCSLWRIIRGKGNISNTRSLSLFIYLVGFLNISPPPVEQSIYSGGFFLAHVSSSFHLLPFDFFFLVRWLLSFFSSTSSSFIFIGRTCFFFFLVSWLVCALFCPS